MCGSCRVTVGGEMKFACVDGADFDGHLVNFDELNLRQKRFAREEKEALERFRNESAKMASLPRPAPQPSVPIGRTAAGAASGAASRRARGCRRTSRRFRRSACRCRTRTAQVRAHNFKEVALGLDMAGALHEAERCLRCKKPRCVPGCPVSIDIPGFIAAIAAAGFQAELPDPEELERAAGGVRAGLPAGVAVRGDVRGGREVRRRWRSGGWSGSSPISPWGAAGTRFRQVQATPEARRDHRVGSVGARVRGRPGAQRREGHDLRGAARGRRRAEVRHPGVPPAGRDHRHGDREPAEAGRGDPAGHDHRQALHHPAAAGRDGVRRRVRRARARGRRSSPAFPARRSTASSRRTSF